MSDLTPEEEAEFLEREAAHQKKIESGEIVDTTHVGSEIAEFSLPKNAPAIGMAKRKMPFCPGGPGRGYELAKLLQKAAGLDGFRLRAISCSISLKEAVTFTVEILGDKDDVAAAVAANQE